jgi:hypothetical protein
LSILAATCALSFSSADAQALRKDNGPAELPPASFKASQYVDSTGCVYIRAGVDGNVNWVPRVSRKREVVCGLSPSIRSGGTTAAAPKAAAPVQIGAATAPKSPAATTIRPARTTVAAALAPKPVRTVASKPVVKTRAAPTIRRVNQPQAPAVAAPTRRVQAVQQRAPQKTQRIVRVAPQAQVAQKSRVVTQRAGTSQTCRGASALSQQFIGRGDRAVRCGAQAGSLVTTRAGDIKGGTFRNANGQIVTNVSPNARVVPRHVYEQQQAARLTSPTPKGYRKAWKDDRLNTRRAHQTLGGKARSDLIWSQTVPRRLIARSTGRDVTRSFPGLRYPYTSEAQQNAAWSQGVQVVSTKGQAPRRVQKRQVVRQQAVQPQQQVRISTRSTAPRKPAAAAGKRFVQVGTFGVASNAQNTASRLQRMGIPVRIGKFVRSGKQMRIVLAGPFKSAAHTNGALTAVRNAGFRDAFARN